MGQRDLEGTLRRQSQIVKLLRELLSCVIQHSNKSVSFRWMYTCWGKEKDDDDFHQLHTNTNGNSPRKILALKRKKNPLDFPVGKFASAGIFSIFFHRKRQATHQLKAKQDHDIRVCSNQLQHLSKWKTAGRCKPQNVSNYRNSIDCYTNNRRRMLCTVVPS